MTAGPIWPPGHGDKTEGGRKGGSKDKPSGKGSGKDGKDTK